jgi:Uma2 family endonuclease
MAMRVVLTYADFAAVPADGKRYELHEGEISVTAAPRPRHQLVIGNLYLILVQHVRRLGLGEVFLSPIDVILSHITVLEPDLVYVEAARMGQVSERGIEGAPTLVVEVLSPGTASADRGIKLQLYARHGVPHYWIVDSGAQTIETLQLTGQTYQAGARLEGIAPATLPPFSDLVLDPADVWR